MRNPVGILIVFMLILAAMLYTLASIWKYYPVLLIFTGLVLIYIGYRFKIPLGYIIGIGLIVASILILVFLPQFAMQGLNNLIPLIPDSWFPYD